MYTILPLRLRLHCLPLRPRVNPVSIRSIMMPTLCGNRVSGVMRDITAPCLGGGGLWGLSLERGLLPRFNPFSVLVSSFLGFLVGVRSISNLVMLFMGGHVFEAFHILSFGGYLLFYSVLHWGLWSLLFVSSWFHWWMGNLLILAPAVPLVFLFLSGFPWFFLPTRA